MCFYTLVELGNYLEDSCGSVKYCIEYSFKLKQVFSSGYIMSTSNYK